MKTRVLADNWTFQNAAEFLSKGLDGETARELVIPDAENGFGYKDVSAASVRFDALCQMLNHLVLSDEVWVDEAYGGGWMESSPLARAKSERIVVPKAFREYAREWVPAREAMGDTLCVNEALRKAHRKNKEQWIKGKTSQDPFLSQLVWGGSGMLARADFFKLPYSAHPLRQTLFERARCLYHPEALRRLENFVSSERLRICRQVDRPGFVANIQLPPIAVEVIEASSDLSDFVETALQMRDQYKSVRSWISQLERDLSDEDTKKILGHEKRLKSISQHLDSYSSLSPPGDTSVQISIGWLTVSTKGGDPVNAIKNRFGMRAEVNRLVLAPGGNYAMKKLLKMLGEQHTRTGKSFESAIYERMTE